MQTLLGWCDFSIVKQAKGWPKGQIKILITGMNGTWVGEVVRFSVFSAWKAWEVGECARAKPSQKVQLKASRNRVRGRDRSVGERTEVFCLCHCRVKAMERWCGPLPLSVPLSGSNNNLATLVIHRWLPNQSWLAEAWENLLHHVLHMWEGGRTDEQKSHSKSKTSRCEFHWPSGTWMFCLNNFINSYFHHVFRGLFFFSTSGLSYHDIIVKIFHI